MYTRYDRDDVTFEIDWSAYESQGGGGSSGASSSTSTSEEKKLTKEQERAIVAGALAGEYDQNEAIRRLQQGGVSPTDARLKYDQIVRSNTLVKGGYSADMNREIETAKARKQTAADAARFDRVVQTDMGLDDAYVEQVNAYNAGADVAQGGTARPAGQQQTQQQVSGSGGGGGAVQSKPKVSRKYPNTTIKRLAELRNANRISDEDFEAELMAIATNEGWTPEELAIAREDYARPLIQGAGAYATFQQDPAQVAQQELVDGPGYNPRSVSGSLAPGVVGGLMASRGMGLDPTAILHENGLDVSGTPADIEKALQVQAYNDQLREMGLPVNSARAPGVSQTNSVLSSDEMGKQARYERAQGGLYQPYLAENNAREKMLEQAMRQQLGVDAKGGASFGLPAPQAEGAGYSAPQRMSEIDRQAYLRRITNGRLYAL